MCDYLLDKMTHYTEACEPSLVTLTYVPYYDASIIQSKKNLLGEVAMNPLIIEKVHTLSIQQNM